MRVTALRLQRKAVFRKCLCRYQRRTRLNLEDKLTYMNMYPYARTHADRYHYTFVILFL